MHMTTSFIAVELYQVVICKGEHTRNSGFVDPNPRARSASGFGYTNPLLSSVFSDLTHLKQIVIFCDSLSCSCYILDEIVFNNYICIIIIETLPLLPSYITYQLYKYVL